MAIAVYNEDTFLKTNIVNLLKQRNIGLDPGSFWGDDNLAENSEIVWFTDDMTEIFKNLGYVVTDMEPVYNGYMFKADSAHGAVFATVLGTEILPSPRLYTDVPFYPGGTAVMHSMVPLTSREVVKFQDFWNDLPYKDQRRWSFRINSNKQLEAFTDASSWTVIAGKVVRKAATEVKAVYNVL